MYPSLLLSQPLGLLLSSSLHNPASNTYHSYGRYLRTTLLSVFPLYRCINNCLLWIRLCVSCIFLMSTLKAKIPTSGAHDRQGDVWSPHKQPLVIAAKGLLAAIIATTGNCGTYQAKFTGIVMKLNRDTKVSVVSAWPLPPIISTEASCRKLLPVFLAMLRCSVNDIPVLLKGCWLGSAVLYPLQHHHQ